MLPSSSAERSLRRWLSHVAVQVIQSHIQRRGRPQLRVCPDDLAHALADLPSDLALTLRLRRRGLTYREIAVTLGVSTGTVGSRIHRARERQPQPTCP